MTTSTPIYTERAIMLPADRAQDPVVKLMLDNSGRIDQRNSWQGNRDDALAELTKSGALEQAVRLGFVMVFNDPRFAKKPDSCRVICLVPAVGMLATVCGHTDRYAYEIIHVSPSAARIKLRRMKTTPDPSWKRDFSPGGFCGHTHNDGELKYCYESDPDGEIKTAGRCEDGGYTVKTAFVYIGVAREFYDSNF